MNYYMERLVISLLQKYRVLTVQSRQSLGQAGRTAVQSNKEEQLERHRRIRIIIIIIVIIIAAMAMIAVRKVQVCVLRMSEEPENP